MGALFVRFAIFKIVYHPNYPAINIFTHINLHINVIIFFMNKRLILIISSPRSGTNALAESLKNFFPNCHYEGEIFGGGIKEQSLKVLEKDMPEIINFVHGKETSSDYHACELESGDCTRESCVEKNTKILSKLIWMDENCEKIIENLTRSRGNVTIIKICNGQLSEYAVEKIINRFNPKVVVLRRNMIFSYVSHIRAMQTNSWFDSITSDTEYKLNENRVYEYIDRTNGWFFKINKFLKNNEIDHIDLTFSEILESDEGLIKLNNFIKNWRYEESPESIIFPDTMRQDIRTDKSLLFMLEQFTKLSKDCQEKVLKLPGGY